MTFASPYTFLLLALIPLLTVWYILLRRNHEPALRMPSLEVLRKAPSTFRTACIHIPFVLRLLSIVLLTVILARPQTSTPQSDAEVKGIDIMMAVDISVSMLTPDLQPNRIEAAKSVAVEFISGRPHDNIGLTLFGGEAFTQCPMTTDHAALLSMFRNVNCNLQQSGAISDGTAIGMGVTSAVSRLVDSKAASKVVILLTDGANNTGDISPLTAAEIAQKHHIRIYTIAVGKQGKVRVPVAQLPNGEYYYQVMESDMDPQTLKKIAEMTGGLYYAADSKNKLRDIYKDIDRLERSKLQVHNYHKRYEAYQPYALMLLLLLLLEIILRLTWLRHKP